MKLQRIHNNSDSWRNTPATYIGSRYAPVLHSVVIDTVAEFLYKKGLEVKKEHYLTDSQALKAIGVINLGSLDDELDFTIAWRNSLDGTRSFAVVSGSVVSICSNMNIWGDSYEFKRKHTGSAEEEIIVALTRAIEDFNVVYKEHRAIRDLLKEQFIDHATRSYILGELFLTNVLAANQISIMKREIEAASFDYKSKDTLWEIYNHATLSLKEGHPANWVESHKKLSQTFKQWI